MRQTDRAMLALIWISALGGVGVTSILYERLADSVTHESTFFFAEPLEVNWKPAEEMEAEPLRETPVEVRSLLFGRAFTLPTGHLSYGHTIRVRPVEMHFQTNGLKLKANDRLFVPLWKNSISFDFRVQPIEVPISEPSSTLGPGG